METMINNRGVITPALKALKKRTNICMQVIHKLSTDMATRLDIFGVYIQPHFIGCLVVLAFAPKTTVTAFCTHFMTTLEKIGDHHKHFKVRELLIALNKIHPLDRIQNVYKSIYSHNWRNGTWLKNNRYLLSEHKKLSTWCSKTNN